MPKKRKSNKFIVAMRLANGATITREVAAEDGACALGLVLDTFEREPDYVSLTVAPARPRSTSVAGEKAATAAVKQTMSRGFAPELCGLGILEAYATAIAEGSS